MTSLKVSATIPSGVDLLGKSIGELQENVVVGEYNITGTLHHVTGWTAFSGDPAEQSGNYIALYVDCPGVDGATYKTQVIGGTHGETTLDSDQTCIYRIANRNQKIKVTVEADGDSYSRTYALGSLTLES